MLKPVRTVAPSAELISLDEAKLHLHVDHSDDDTLIGSLVAAATKHLDGYQGILQRALCTQTWKIETDTFADPLRLPVGDLLSLTSVKYYDGLNVQQTLSASVYGVYSDAIGPFVSLKANQVWPVVYDRRDAIEIIWTAGFGTTANQVPQPIRQAVLLMVGHWYAHREAVSETALAEVPMSAKHLIEPFRLNAI
jgi:uncharacterized phiE125 gp8 family phage protein